MNSLLELPRLYRLPPGTCCWGGDSGAGEASEAMAAATREAIAFQKQMYEEAKGMTKEFRGAGDVAVKQLAGLAGLPGYTALDPTAILEATPGYGWLKNKGLEALARYGAKTGRMFSGPALAGATTFGEELGKTYAWGPYMSSLQNLYTGGLQGAGITSGQAIQTGGSVANLLQALGQAQAMGIMGQHGSENSFLSDIMGGLGMFGSLIAAPFTGGTSLLGMGVGALGNLFGGGTSGGFYGIPTVGYGGGGAWGGGIGGGLGILAEGGPAYSGRPYIVGERGPEIFVPATSGYVVPNHLTQYNSLSPYRLGA